MRKDYPTAFYAAAAIAAIIGLLSAGANGWFCFQAGKAVTLGDIPYFGTVTAGHGRALLSFSADLLKDFLCVLIAAAFLAKGVSWWVRGFGIVACSALFVPLVLNSWTYANGAMALINSDNTSVRAHEIETKRRLVSDEARLEKKNPWTAETVAYKDTPLDALGKLIEAYKDDRLWSSSAGCTSKTSEAERKYCKGFTSMTAALAISAEQAEDHKDLQKIKAQLAALAAVPLVANPANEVLAKSLGTDADGAMAFAGALGAYILEGVPTGVPAILYFFAVAILKPKEDAPVAVAAVYPVATPRAHPAPKIILTAVEAVQEDPRAKEALAQKPKASRVKIEADAPEPAPALPEPAAETAPDLATLEKAIKTQVGKVAFPALQRACEAAVGRPLDKRTVAAALKKIKGVSKIEGKGDRDKFEGKKTVWYKITGSPRLVENVA